MLLSLGSCNKSGITIIKLILNEATIRSEKPCEESIRFALYQENKNHQIEMGTQEFY